MFKPVRVTPLSGFRIRIAYEDGVEGVVDLSHLAGRGVFKLWDDPGAFDAVRIAGDGAIQWSDDVEFCPDSVYLELTNQPPEAVFSSLSRAGTYAGD